jgi:hypothetical protein
MNLGSLRRHDFPVAAHAAEGPLGLVATEVNQLPKQLIKGLQLP